jgi:hypothetical protein
MSNLRQSLLGYKENERGRAHSMHEMEHKCINSFGLKTRRKEPLARPRRRWEDSIKTDLK